MVPFSMTSNDPYHRFQGRAIIQRFSQTVQARVTMEC